MDSLEPAALATAAADGNRGLGFLPVFLHLQSCDFREFIVK